MAYARFGVSCFRGVFLGGGMTLLGQGTGCYQRLDQQCLRLGQGLRLL